MTRVFLGAVALIFIGYGIACALDPALPVRLAGLEISSGDGYAEMSAMYGGLQLGIGFFCALGALREGLRQPALVLLLLGIGLLATFRVAGVLRTDDVVTGYSWGALLFEGFVTLASALLLQRR